MQAQNAGHLEPLDRHVGLIFDWDGTLADSQAVAFAAMAEALTHHGADLHQEWFDARTGISTDEMVSLVGQLQGLELDIPAVVGHRNEAYLARLHQVGEVALVTATLRKHHGTRPLALATGNTRDAVTRTARALGLLSYFDVVVTREDAERGKPAPEIFLTAARRLGLSPSRCLVYEDSDEGMEAAKAAGMDAIDVRALR